MAFIGYHNDVAGCVCPAVPTPNSVAGAIAGIVRESGSVEVLVVGAGALNQCVKAIASARGFVIASGIDLVCVPSFADIELDGERRTAKRLIIDDRQRRVPTQNHGAVD
jgi:stage V sporulation protein S